MGVGAVNIVPPTPQTKVTGQESDQPNAAAIQTLLTGIFQYGHNFPWPTLIVILHDIHDTTPPMTDDDGPINIRIKGAHTEQMNG